jgi:hypothetical protein
MKPKLPYCSKEHDYSTEHPRLRFADGGRYLRLQFALSPAAQWNQEQFSRIPEGRGKCKGFSRGSRRRLLDRLNTVSKAADLPAFITMTFPDDVFMDNAAEFAAFAKAKLDTFLKRLRRVEPAASGVWRIEWQSRKSGSYEGKLFPHFHLLVWGLPKRLLGERDVWVTTNEGRRVLGPSVQVWENFVHTPDTQLSLELLNLWAEPKGSTEAERSAKAYCKLEIGAGDCMPAFTFEGSRKFIERCERLHSDVWVENISSARVASTEQGQRGRNMSFQDWASLAWYHVVDSHNLDHLTAGVRVESVRSWGGVMSYAAKYLGKAGDHFLSEVEFGRSWGIFNRVSVPWAKLVDLDLDTDLGIRLRRIARRYLERRLGRRKNVPYGITLYCDVDQFRKLWERPPPDPF